MLNPSDAAQNYTPFEIEDIEKKASSNGLGAILFYIILIATIILLAFIAFLLYQKSLL